MLLITLYNYQMLKTLILPIKPFKLLIFLIKSFLTIFYYKYVYI